MSDAFSINRLYELTGVDRRTIKKRLTASGVVPAGDGYPAPSALKAIFGDSKKKTEDIATSEARIFSANARTAEVKANKAEEKVIESAIVDLAWSEVTVLIAQKLDLVTPKFRSRYVVGMSEDDAAGIIEQDLQDIRNDLSKPVTYEESKDSEETAEPGVEESGAETETAD
jgi:phage terminase Nu1 subunit (DNA packaging protein)